MPDLRYEAPGTLADAVKALTAAGGVARVLAGGTDVIVQMETDLIEPDLLVDLKRIPDLNRIAQENGGWRIGETVSGMTIVDGLWANTRDALVGDFATVVWRMKLLGVNAVRVPFSFLEFAKTPQSVVWPSCGGIDANRVRSNVIPPGVNVPSSAVPPPLPTAGNISRTPGVCNEYIKGKTSRERLLWVTKFLADNGFYVILDDHLVR